MSSLTDRRSALREVRNPILALPAFKLLLALPAFARRPLVALLLSIRADARDRSAKCWATHKGPMALYWKGVAVYAGHIARALR